MTSRKIALIDTTGSISQSQLFQVAKAVELQVQRDFSSVWDITAEITVQSNNSPIEADVWPVFIQSELDVKGVYGYHWIDDVTNKPFARILYRDNYTLTVSHEILEMLVNPYLTRYQVTDISTDIPGDEKFLLEVVGPVQDVLFGYYINNILVSNFMYPSYFDLIAISGKKYDHLGLIKKPKSILSGGYISFIDNLGQWWQAFGTQNKIDLKKLVDGQSVDGNTLGRLLRGAVMIGGSALFIYTFLKFTQRNELHISKNRR